MWVICSIFWSTIFMMSPLFKPLYQRWALNHESPSIKNIYLLNSCTACCRLLTITPFIICMYWALNLFTAFRYIVDTQKQEQWP